MKGCVQQVAENMSVVRRYVTQIVEGETFDKDGVFLVVSGHFLGSVCGEADGTFLFLSLTMSCGCA